MSATPEQPPAAPDAPVAPDADVTPTSAAPPPFTPAPPIEPVGAAAPSASASAGSDLVEQHPEALVGGAFVGGAVLAIVLKRLGRR